MNNLLRTPIAAKTLGVFPPRARHAVKHACPRHLAFSLLSTASLRSLKPDRRLGNRLSLFQISMSTPHGQWSEAMTCGQMKASEIFLLALADAST